MAWASFDASKVLLSDPHLKWFRSSTQVERGSCPVCSATLTYAHDSEPGRVDIAIATLDDPSQLAPEFHIWVSEKLPWIVIADGLPQYDEWRPRASA